ncbi:MAG: succinate dehydrogenase, cytochrome b556 subunit [Pseudomonadota bacterium]
MAARPARPLSPHLGIWKWGPHMLVSIVHRATGTGMALVGIPLFLWWLTAAAAGQDSYAGFVDTFTLTAGGLNILGWIVGIGLVLAFFQHLLSGVRHFFLDAGALFELKPNKTAAVATIAGSVVLTAVFWVHVAGWLK